MRRLILDSLLLKLAVFILFSAAIHIALPSSAAYAQQVQALSVAKTFSPNYISPNKTSVLTIILTNPNASTANVTTAFTDFLPANVSIVGAAAGSAGCTGTALTNTATSITLPIGAIIAASGSCTITATVTSAIVGVYPNNTSNLITSVGGAASASAQGASATLVVNMPSIKKTFSPDEISTLEATILTLTLTNPLLVPAVLSAPLIDSLPDNLDICNEIANTCGGSVHIEDSTLTLSDATIPGLGSCFVKVEVISDCPGNYTNTLPIGALQTDQGFNAMPACASLTVCVD